MEPIVIRYTWTAEDLRVGRKYFQKCNRLVRRLPLFITAILLSIAILTSHHNPENTTASSESSIIGLIVVGGTLLLGIFIGVPVAKAIQGYFTRREFSKRPDANSEIEWVFTEEDIRTTSENSNSVVKWAAFHKVVSTPVGFLFLPNSNIFHYLPNRAFESLGDIENLKILARQHAKEFKEVK